MATSSGTFSVVSYEPDTPTRSNVVQQVPAYFFSGHLKCGLSDLGRVDLEWVGDVPGQEFFDSIDRIFGDRCQDRAQVEGRIESVQLGCSDKAIERRGALAAGTSFHKQIVLQADGYGTQRPFVREL
jgi:hypothetical protein